MHNFIDLYKLIKNIQEVKCLKTSSRGQFSSTIDCNFISWAAVGLNNIWKFPYIAGKSGEEFSYILCIVCINIRIPLIIAETAIGRKTGLNPIGAYKSLIKSGHLLVYLYFNIILNSFVLYLSVDG